MRCYDDSEVSLISCGVVLNSKFFGKIRSRIFVGKSEKEKSGRIRLLTSWEGKEGREKERTQIRITSPCRYCIEKCMGQ